MRALDLNLATRPFRNNTVIWLGHGLLAVAVVVFTAWNTVTFVETGRTLAEQRSTVGSLSNRKEAVEARERRVQAEVGRHNIKGLTAETARANDVIERKAMSWTRLFNLLEAMQPYEVRMVSVRPVFGGAARRVGTPVTAEGPEAIPVSVDGTARDLRAFLEFERALIHDPHVDRVEPERTTHTKGGEVLFSLTFLYYPEEIAGPPGPEQAAAQGGSPAQGGEAEPENGEPEPPPENVEGTATPPPGAALPVDQAEGAAGPASLPAGSGSPPAATTTHPSPPPPAPSASVPLLTNVAAPSPERPADTESAGSSDGAEGRAERPKKQPPAGPIRKRPPGWQPPDPFAKDKKPATGDPKAPATGDGR